MRNRFICILFGPVAAAAGCINADPSTFPSNDAGPIVRPDVLGDGDTHAGCRACLEAPEDPGPGCAGPLAVCMADEKCPIIYECGFVRECWSLPTQTEVTSCGFPCFQEAGVTSLGDPVVAVTLGVLACVLGACQPACGANP
jgi:hypothetical protein